MELKKVELDPRYVGLLADTVPKSPPKMYGNISRFAGLLIVLGGLLFLSGHLYGWAIMLPAFILVLVMMVFQNKFNKKARQEFIDYFNRTGQLMPYPETKKVELPKQVGK
jgi:hypothetical protein